MDSLVPSLARLLLALVCIAGLSESSGAQMAHEGQLTDGAVLKLPGILQPSREVELAAPLDGVVYKVFVEEGDYIQAGQVVAMMDNRVVEADVRLAEATVQRQAAVVQAVDEIGLAERELERIRKVHARHAVTDTDLDIAKSRVNQARASLDAALEAQREAGLQLQLARARLETHNVRAPFDGMVTRVEAREGEAVGNAEHLVTVVNTQSLRVELHLPVTWYGEMTAGEMFTLTTSWQGDTLAKAKLINVDPMIDAATRTFRAVLEVANESEKLPAGITVTGIQSGQKAPVQLAGSIEQRPASGGAIPN